MKKTKLDLEHKLIICDDLYLQLNGKPFSFLKIWGDVETP